MTDPIADMLTRIRNATLVNKGQLSMPYSKTKAHIASVLVKSGFLASSSQNKENKRVLDIELNEPGKRTVTEIHRISKPGRRVYVKAQEIPRVLNGRGIVVVSTPQGVMSGEEARKKSTGGELICKVW